MAESRLGLQSVDFAVSIIKLVERLGESVLTRKLGERGTAIGACVRKSLDSRIQNDEKLRHLQDAIKASEETGYWLELLFRSGHLSAQEYQMLDSDCTGLRVMLMSAITSLK